MGAELSLKFAAQEDVSTATKSAAAGVDALQKSLGGANAAAQAAAKGLDDVNKTATQAGGNVVNLADRFHGLKQPIAQVSQLANGLGTAFGGAASKATGLINGLVGGLATGRPGYVAVAATVGIVSILISKFTEAREAAEKARQAQIDEQIATAKSVEDAIGKADEEIANLKARLGRGEDAATVAAQAAATQAELDKKQALVEAEQNLSRLQRERLDRDEKGRSRVSQEEIDAADHAVFQAKEALQTQQATNGALAQRLALLKDLRIEANAPTGGGGPKVPKGPKGPNNDPKVEGDVTTFDIPELEMEEAGRAQVRAYYKGWREEEEKLAKERQERAREFAKQQADVAAEATKERLADREEMKQVGLQVGFAYLDAIGQAIKGDGKGALKSALNILGSMLGLGIGFLLGNPALGAQIGAGFSNFAGGFLRDGGEALQVSVPKARRGMAFVDMDSDGKLIEGHAGEVMLNAGAVARNGGIDRVARQNNPFSEPLDEGGGGGTVNLYLSTLVPQDGAAAVRQVMEPGMIANLSNHQSGMLERQLRSAAAMPRYE